MTYEQIALLTVESELNILIQRLVDLTVVPETEAPYFMDQEVEGDFYAKLTFHELLVKPTLEALEAELVVYKNELTAVEDARLAEIARVEALTARWNALPDTRLAMKYAGLDQPNDLMLLKQIIDDNDEIKMAALEANVAAINDEMQFTKDFEKSSAKMQLGLSAINLMAAINNSKSLTGEQVAAMLIALDAPSKLLSSGSIGTAIGAIQAMALPDNITESDRTKILSFLTTKLAEIEARYA